MARSSTSAALNPTPLLEDPPILLFPVGGNFDPDPFDVEPDEYITLKYNGEGLAEVNVYDSNDDLYALFKGSSNPYSASGDGTAYQIRDDAPEDSSYTIEYDPESAAAASARADDILVVAVRGTINVKKPNR